MQFVNVITFLSIFSSLSIVALANDQSGAVNGPQVVEAPALEPRAPKGGKGSGGGSDVSFRADSTYRSHN